jgi:hypothetical protein
MSSAHSLNQQNRKAGQVNFDRNELRILLHEYSRRVAAGEWRDYAIDMLRERAVFSVFRHTAEHPLYSIEKYPARGNQAQKYVVSRGPQQLKQGQDLLDVLSAIKHRPKLVALS